MESRGPGDSKNVKTSQAYFFEGFIIFFEDFSLTIVGILYKSSQLYENVLENQWFSVISCWQYIYISSLIAPLIFTVATEHCLLTSAQKRYKKGYIQISFCAK